MEDDKIKILIVDNSFGWTGAIRSILNLVQQMGVDFIIAIPKRSQLVSSFKVLGIPHKTFSFLEISKHWSTILYFPVLVYNSIRILGFCRKNNIDIIHINDLYNLVGIVLKIFSPSLKVIYHVRLLPSSYISILYRFWVKLAARYADEIITVSQISKKNIHLYTERNVTVIYDSVVVPIIPFPERKNDGNVLFLYPSNYTLGKGQDLGIEAFAEALKENSNIYLKFIGGELGQKKNILFKEKLKKRIAALQLDGKIVLGDFEENIMTEMANHDVVLNLSKSESFSMVCLEALMLGKVLIATDSGGPSELFENGKSGILVQRGIEEIKDAILLVSRSYELRKKIGMEGKIFATNKFNLKNATFQLKQIYLS